MSSRRAVYLPVIRNDMYPLFSTFDYPDSSVPIDARPRTVVSQQALFMLNSDLVGSQAERLASRLLDDPDLEDDADRVRMAHEICYSRKPTPEESARALDFLSRMEGEIGSTESLSWPPAMEGGALLEPREHAWRTYCQVLMASNEFIYVH